MSVHACCSPSKQVVYAHVKGPDFQMKACESVAGLALAATNVPPPFSPLTRPVTPPLPWPLRRSADDKAIVQLKEWQHPLDTEQVARAGGWEGRWDSLHLLPRGAAGGLPTSAHPTCHSMLAHPKSLNEPLTGRGPHGGQERKGAAL